MVGAAQGVLDVAENRVYPLKLGALDSGFSAAHHHRLMNAARRGDAMKAGQPIGDDPSACTEVELRPGGDFGTKSSLDSRVIRKEFRHIFASGFSYDENDIPKFAAQSVNYTTKTQYLFRINKGVLNSWDNEEINSFTPEEERPRPFSRMIYIGDGETDVPAMKMVNYQGGYSIAVYPPRKGKKRT